MSDPKMPGGVDASPPTPSADPVGDWHNSARAQFDKIQEGYEHLKALRSELDSLKALGDMVGPEDVVKGAAALVGKGFAAQELAVMLSEMPAGGEALQQWILTQDHQVTQMEMNAEGMLAQARHQLGLSALHVLMGDHLAPGQGPSTPPVSGPPNPLTSGPPSAQPTLTPATPTQGNA